MPFVHGLIVVDDGDLPFADRLIVRDRSGIVDQVEDVVHPMDRVIYTTITLMSVLVVYDGWATLSFGGVAAVIIGPMLAIPRPRVRSFSGHAGRTWSAVDPW